MLGALLSLLVLSGGLWFYVQSVVEQNAAISADLKRVSGDLQLAGKVNRGLVKSNERLRAEQLAMQAAIDRSEFAKAEIRNDLQKANAQLDEALKDEEIWSQAPIPEDVADSVNLAIERLRVGAIHKNGDGRGGAGG